MENMKKELRKKRITKADVDVVGMNASPAFWSFLSAPKVYHMGRDLHTSIHTSVNAFFPKR